MSPATEVLAQANAPLDYFSNQHSRGQFAALYTLFVWSGLLWLARTFLHRSRFVGMYNRAELTDDERYEGVGSRANNGAKLGLLLTFMLTTVLLMNVASTGGMRGVQIIAWLFVAFGIIWTLIEMAIQNRLIRFGFGLVEYALALAIGALSFSKGWPWA
ncbi:MAG: hypothetical protein DHS80DRAFT_22479 [Piptocephalis tieghemiana]|nr:MAG: hypothetical protein DHS80DRAFT_22479 [Piptocephalis tieghemiana]